jgi:hypothetical protein
MKLITVEIRYDGGTVITDRVSLDDESGKITLPPRLCSALDTLDEWDHRESFTAHCSGVDLPVEGDREHGYLISFHVRSQSKHSLGISSVRSQTTCQRKLNGHFAHMLSALALVGACFEVATARPLSGMSLLEPAILLVLAVVLFVLGHWCFSTRDISDC